eukprot:1394744-Amorphochlora_amoeboformis.AAC.1
MKIATLAHKLRGWQGGNTYRLAMNSPLRALGISQVYGSVDSDGSEGKRGGLRQRLLAWDRFAWMFGLIGGVALSFLLVTTIMSDPRKKSATGSEHVDIDLSDAFGSIFTVDQAPVLIAACFLVLMAASMVVVRTDLSHPFSKP